MLRVAPGLITSPAAESAPSVVTLTGFRISTSWGDVGGAPPSQFGPALQGPLLAVTQMTMVKGPLDPTVSLVITVMLGPVPGRLMVKGLPLSSKNHIIGLGCSSCGGGVELPLLPLPFRLAGLSVRNSCCSISCSNAYCEFVTGSVVTSGCCPTPCGVT